MVTKLVREMTPGRGFSDGRGFWDGVAFMLIFPLYVLVCWTSEEL